MISSGVVGLKNIDRVKEPLRKLRCEADDGIPLAKSGPMLEKSLQLETNALFHKEPKFQQENKQDGADEAKNTQDETVVAQFAACLP